jgi:chromosome segregation ATPase
MIKGLIAKLEKEQEEEATEKAYCDDEMSKTKYKKGELEEQMEDLGAHLDQSKAKSTQIKEDVQELQQQLVFLEKERVELDKIRKDEPEVFMKAKKDLELGIEGVREAHAVLKDFYASKDETSEASSSFLQVLRQPTPPEVDTQKNSNAAGSIMSILEVTESDFASSLAKAQTEEANAQAEYEKATQEHALEKAAKEQEAKFKTKEFKRLDKKVVQLADDKDSTKSEQAAVLDFYEKLKDRCVAEPTSFEVRKKKREAEIMGLKEAQEILKNEAAFAQRQSFGRRLRGNH